MAKIILTDGSEEFLSPAAARAKVAADEAKFPTPVPMYSTRQMVAEPVKVKRKRRTKAEMEESLEPEETPETGNDEPESSEPETQETPETGDDEPESV
jgi:hypothetical protein